MKDFVDVKMKMRRKNEFPAELVSLNGRFDARNLRENLHRKRENVEILCCFHTENFMSFKNLRKMLLFKIYNDGNSTFF